MSSDESNSVEIELKRTDLRIKRLDVIAKFIGAAVLLVGIAVPFYQYTRTLEKERRDRADKKAADDQQLAKQVEAARIEAQKPFLQRQQELYFAAAVAASRLATLDLGPERDAARKRFYELYWGELSIVEDKLVEKAMVRFADTLDDFEQKKFDKDSGTPKVDKLDLQQKSLELAHACRDSLARGFGYDRAEPKSTPPAP